MREFTRQLFERLDGGAQDEEIRGIIKDQVSTIYRLIYY